MLPIRRSVRVALLLAPGLLVTYLAALRAGFLSDDYLFLEQARAHRLLDWLFRLDALGNYWRPLSRQVYFELLSPIAGGSPLVFHAANFLLFLAALALLADLLAAFVLAPAAAAGVLFFALLPMQRVNLTWVSCSQELMALVGSLAAVALWRRERRTWALAAWLAAIASKETALPLPLALAGWDLLVARRSPREAAIRLWPFLALGALWVALVLGVRGRSGGPLPLHFTLEAVAAAGAHLVQSLLGIEHPAGFVPALLHYPPPPVALLLIAAALLLLVAPGSNGPTDARTAARFAALWLVAFALPIWPVVSTWSGYYYTLAAAGAALLVALLARRLGRRGAVVLAAGLLWWHQGGTQTRAFAIVDQPWGWTSHLTTFYLARGSALADTLARQLRAIEPAPPHDARFFFATLPPWAGFQMGNGPLIRSLYRDPSLRSYYYSQFGDSTADRRDCRFYYWNGARLEPLYAGLRDPYFQVGCDLLLLDRPEGAAHAFRRALETGGRREDNLYWMGWALLWSGRRDESEAAWRAFGAHDDSAAFSASYRAVRTTLYERADTLESSRLLMRAIRAGIGQPHPHAILGELLASHGGEDGRYGLMELKVATWLDRRDILAARELIAGLIAVQLDEPARRELARLQETDPDWRSDTLTVRLARTLEQRAPPARDVASYEREDSRP